MKKKFGSHSFAMEANHFYLQSSVINLRWKKGALFLECSLTLLAQKLMRVCFTVVSFKFMLIIFFVNCPQ